MRQRRTETSCFFGVVVSTNERAVVRDKIMTNDKFCNLLDRIIHNDISALKAIYEEYFSKVQYTALNIVNNESDAYDIAENVFMKLIDYPSNPYAIHNHIGLLISMTRHEALNYLRRRAQSVAFDDKSEVATARVDGNSLWFQDILNLLSEEERLIFTEHCIWGKSLKVISKEKGISYRTIVRTYADIKGKIKQLYNE